MWRRWWISKGSSNFCNELIESVADDNSESLAKHKPDDFYDLVSTKDTIEGGIHVIEKSAYDTLLAENKRLEADLKTAVEALAEFCSAYINQESLNGAAIMASGALHTIKARMGDKS